MTSALPILHGPDRPELLRGEVLADLFEATAARLPHKTALIAGGEHLSYGALNAAADLAAHRLILAGVRPGDMVGLWLPRGLELLICQLAIARLAPPGCRLTPRCRPSASPSAWTMPTPAHY